LTQQDFLLLHRNRVANQPLDTAALRDRFIDNLIIVKLD
jgi:hypothetical protein